MYVKLYGHGSGTPFQHQGIQIKGGGQFSRNIIPLFQQTGTGSIQKSSVVREHLHTLAELYLSLSLSLSILEFQGMVVPCLVRCFIKGTSHKQLFRFSSHL
jgi:hypothetical protein